MNATQTNTIAVATLKLAHALIKKVYATRNSEIKDKFENAREFCPNCYEAKIGSYTFDDGVRADLYVRHGFYDDKIYIVRWYDKDGNCLDTFDDKRNTDVTRIRHNLETKYESTFYVNGEDIEKHGHELTDKQGITHVLNVEDELPEAVAELERTIEERDFYRKLAEENTLKAERLDTLVNGKIRHLTEQGYDLQALLPNLPKA